MMASNPYESPKTTTDTEPNARYLPFDVGRFVGRYLQVLAGVSIVPMVVNLLFFDQFFLDLSFLFFYWAGACLIRHSPTARKWVIGVSGLTVIMCFGLLLYAVTVGTDGMTVTIGRRIDNPPIGYVVGLVAFLVLVVGGPLALLLTQQAKNEFSRNANAA